MQLFEGERKNYSEAFHENELVIVDTSDQKRNRVYSIPEALVVKKGQHPKGGTPNTTEIRDSKLPLTVRVLDYWLNCDVEARPPAEAAAVGADHGSFTNMLLLPLAEN